MPTGPMKKAGGTYPPASARQNSMSTNDEAGKVTLTRSGFRKAAKLLKRPLVTGGSRAY